MSVLSNRVLFYGIFEFPKEKRQMFWCFCLWGHFGHLFEVKRCFSKIVIWKNFINLPKIPKDTTSIHTCAIKPSVYISGQWCCDIICRLTLCRLPISLCCLACLPASPYSKTISVFEKKNNQPTYRPTTTKRKWLIIDFIRYRFRSTTTTKIQF